eukprot:281117-Amphidinium_carterae.4
MKSIHCTQVLCGCCRLHSRHSIGPEGSRGSRQTSPGQLLRPVACPGNESGHDGASDSSTRHGCSSRGPSHCRLRHLVSAIVCASVLGGAKATCLIFTVLLSFMAVVLIGFLRQGSLVWSGGRHGADGSADSA